KTKDQSLCGFLAANEIKDADSYYENHTKSNCQNELHYTYGDADWRLGQYKPDEPYYMGSATIEGWMIFTTSYVSGLSAHFHVSPNSIEKLPPSLQNQEDFLVQYRDKDGRWQRLEDESEMPSLFKYSEKNPGKIKITGILRQMEGSPYISLESVINESAFDQCVTSENAQSQDSCLFDLAQNDFYDLEELKYLPEEVCGKILENSTERAQCFWGYAMRLKNEELCKFLPQEIKEIAETMKGYSYPVDYTTQNECKKAIQYTYQGAEWKLTYGIPPYADPFTLIYEGSAEISGWMSYEMVYDEKMLMFHVEDTSIKKLPLVAQQRSEYFLKYKDANGEVQTVKEENQIPELFKYDTTNPATIKVTKIIMRMEGSPSIILEKIIE
ncbi:hypothetical protein HY604_02290, partial [Candidatus Peregrinibacteria bacterium]|nr:hypothetical protein [Candidatus Peregrinibacteria bacterium]